MSWLGCGGAGRPQWPSELGALTGLMHLRLAEGATDVQLPLAARARSALSDALELANPVVSSRAALFNDLIGEFTELADDRVHRVFSIHGDLHVGQIVRSPVGYRILDFDGDPTLPPQERDLPDTAARDVAHLLTSVQTVASVAQSRLGARSDVVLAWSDAAQQELLAAYRTHAGHLLDERLLPALQAEQLLRELLYAHRYLPRWRYAAEGAIMHRFPIPNEDPWTPPSSPLT